MSTKLVKTLMSIKQDLSKHVLFKQPLVLFLMIFILEYSTRLWVITYRLHIKQQTASSYT